MKSWLFTLALVASSVTAEPAPVPDSAAVRDWFRMAELDAGPSVRSRLLAGQDPNVMNERGQRALHWALMNDSGKALQV
ncbi:MAG: hypothetical protein ACOVN9_03435, partial [Inhella sp.]